MDYFDSIDDASAALILEIQLQEAIELSEATEIHEENRQRTDVQFAINTYRNELEQNFSILRDRIMTRSIAQACHLDGLEVSHILLDPDSEEDNDSHTVDLNQNTTLRNVEIEYGEHEDTHESEDNVDFQTGSRKTTNRNLYHQGQLNDQPETHRSHITFVPEEVTYGTCDACQEGYASSRLAHCTCNHSYCRECLMDLFNASITDDGLFPPRCCKQPILITNVHMFLTPEIIRRFEAKKVEMETVDRMYCSNQVCSIFITAENISGDKAECPACGTVSCIICKAASHNGDCPADIGLQNVLDLAKDNGWQRCFNCRRVIELDVGCNHMTCLCGTEFCYVCAARWKTCTCPQWDEGLLLARANVIVARQPEDEIRRENQVEVVVNNLRLRHNCDHNDWTWVRGRHQCEVCFHTLPSYIFECPQCLIRACTRCRRSRL